jgi:hypothetical protein
MTDQPQCTEVRIHRGGDGKVAIIDYGKVSSGYSDNITRSYQIPEEWTDEQVEEFEDKQLEALKPRIDAVLDAEFVERWEQKAWRDD